MLYRSLKSHIKASTLRSKFSRLSSRKLWSATPDLDSIGLSVFSKEDYALIKVLPPPVESRIPTDLCCVIDVSYSMGENAYLKTAANQIESYGLRVIDIVKHAMSTIVNTLGPEDRLSIVTFSDDAVVVLPPTPINAYGKSESENVINQMTPTLSTNLWAGIKTGMDVISKSQGKSARNSAIFVLTDGQPNIIPPRGHVFMMQQYKNSNPVNFSLNTFGFGYHLDSEELVKISSEGCGSYSFIPDSSFVGTVFVHSLSNLLTTVGTNLSLNIEPAVGTVIKEIPGYGKKSSQNITFNLGSLRHGQTKDILVRLNPSSTGSSSRNPRITATLTHHPVDGENRICKISSEQQLSQQQLEFEKEIEQNRIRLEFVDVIGKIMNFMRLSKIDSAQNVLADFITQVKQSPLSSDEFTTRILQDLEGQVSEGCSRMEYYEKWGKHFFPSLADAHLQQQANNFKDPGVQNYGGKVFLELRDKIDQIFCNLPPPEIPYYRQLPTTGFSMATYNYVGNPCFSGNCDVLMSDGITKKVMSLRKGDFVKCPNGESSHVICVVKTHCYGGSTELVEFASGLQITPWHPVRINGNWEFPNSIGNTERRTCSAVYSFVLEAQHVMIINGVECVTLGHNFTEDVVEHPYYGTSKVISDLKTMTGWEKGIVELDGSCCVVRDRKGLVCGLTQQQNFQETPAQTCN